MPKPNAPSKIPIDRDGPNVARQIGQLSPPTDYQTLPFAWWQLHKDLVKSGLWKMPESRTRKVHWTPWKCWKASGYHPNKLRQLIKWYMLPGVLTRGCTLIQKALGSTRAEWSSVALPLGDPNPRPISPTKYKLGQCLQTVIFKFHPDVGMIPHVVWRICEPTRRLLADFVILDNIFRYVTRTTGLEIHHVELDLNLVWLANFNAPLAEAWMPGLKKIVPRYHRRFEMTDTPPKYRARKCAWDLVHNARPMFSTKNNDLKRSHFQHDWPDLRKELIL